MPKKGFFLSFTQYILIFNHTLYQHLYFSAEPVGSKGGISIGYTRFELKSAKNENKKFALFFAQHEVNNYILVSEMRCTLLVLNFRDAIKLLVVFLNA
jgi:hypothetical protein